MFKNHEVKTLANSCVLFCQPLQEVAMKVDGFVTTAIENTKMPLGIQKDGIANNAVLTSASVVA